MTIANLETIIDMQSCCTTWPPNGSSRIRAKQKLVKKHREACESSWSQIGNHESFTLTTPWNLAKPVKIFPGIIVRQHNTDQKQMALLKEQCAEKKKAPLPYCCNQVCMTIGGQIPWNAFPICETSQICYPMERRRMRDVLGNHSKDRSFRLVHWLSITLSSAKDKSRIHQIGKKVLPGLFLGYALYAEEVGRVTYWLQTLESWRRWAHLKSSRKDSMRKR